MERSKKWTGQPRGSNTRYSSKYANKVKTKGMGWLTFSIKSLNCHWSIITSSITWCMNKTINLPRQKPSWEWYILYKFLCKNQSAGMRLRSFKIFSETVKTYLGYGALKMQVTTERPGLILGTFNIVHIIHPVSVSDKGKIPKIENTHTLFDWL